jgi:hypothetical protein
MRDRPGGVTVPAINAGVTSHDLDAPLSGKRYTLTARELESKAVQLNGRELQAGSDGVLPPVEGLSVRAGHLRLAPKTITFVTFPDAGNKACQ